MQCHSFSLEFIELHKINSFLFINQLVDHHNNVDIQPWSQVVLFFGQIFIKFQTEKYDYNLYKGFSMKRMAQFRQILKKKCSGFSDFYDKFQYVRSQEYRRILFCLFIYLFSYLVCSQILYIKATVSVCLSVRAVPGKLFQSLPVPCHVLCRRGGAG